MGSAVGHANIFEDLQKAVGASYPQPRINNTSPFRVQGKLSKAACSDDYFDIAAGQTWTATNNRGLCLITGISGRFVDDEGKFAIQSYDSSGTSYAGVSASRPAMLTSGSGRKASGAVTRPVEVKV